MTDRKKSRPQKISAALSSFLEQSGLADRVEQAGVIPEWPALVGPQIAKVTEPQSISRDGTLFVSVSTNSWMTELSLMEPQLLVALNSRGGSSPIQKIHWRLKR